MNLRISTEYDPMGMIYTITTGKHSVILPERAVTEESIKDLAEALKDVNDDNTVKTILNDWATMAESKANGSLSGWRAKVTMSGGKVKATIGDIQAAQSKVDTAVADWANSIPDTTDKDATVACVDYPRMKPYYDPDDMPKLYYHQRFPSKQPEDVIRDALDLLNAKRGLNIHDVKISKSQLSIADRIRHVKPEGKWQLNLSSNAPGIQNREKILIAIISHEIFDRLHVMDDDREAGLLAKLDTDTYIQLRIAYLVNKALKQGGLIRDAFQALEVSSW